jgi:hypothetical protein
MLKSKVLSLASAYKEQLDENVEYYKNVDFKKQLKFYQNEAFNWASKMLGQTRAKASKWECRIVATFWLFGLIFTIPMMTFLAFFWWLKTKKETEAIATTLVPENERKTILITGAPLTKGNLLASGLGFSRDFWHA